MSQINHDVKALAAYSKHFTGGELRMAYEICAAICPKCRAGIRAYRSADNVSIHPKKHGIAEENWYRREAAKIYTMNRKASWWSICKATKVRRFIRARVEQTASHTSDHAKRLKCVWQLMGDLSHENAETHIGVGGLIWEIAKASEPEES